MRKKLTASIFFLVCFFFSGRLFALPPQKLYVGERMVYAVRYLGIEVGRGIAEVKEITEIRGRKAYHVEVQVRSARLLDWIYKVRDVHHSYIDVEKLYSLRYEKILREGRYRANEVMEYDQEEHKAICFSRRSQTRKEMEIPLNVQDQLSCGYWFRLQEIQPNARVYIPVNTDVKNWDLEVKVLKKTKVKLRKFGVRDALEVEPEIQFQGLFVKRGKIRSWIGLDERQIPLKMKVKIPVLGSITAELVEYKP